MFDKQYTHIHPGHSTVTENRAPTDESVRLLKEFERAAATKILNSVTVDNNVLNGIVLEMEMDPISSKRKYVAVFVLNDTRYEIVVGQSTNGFVLDQTSAMETLFKAMAKVITFKLLTEAK